MTEEESSIDPRPKSWIDKIAQVFSDEPTDTKSLLELLRNAEQDQVLDADALNMVARHPSLSNAVLHRPFPTVLTPHAGEAARLLSTTPHTIQQQRTIAIQALVEKFQCTVVLKGAGTLTASPQQPIRQCFRGSPRLARAGTGDVLAGMIAGLLAQAHAGQSKLHPQTWAEQAVVLHARAGEEPHWYRAGQLPSLIADLIAESYAG